MMLDCKRKKEEESFRETSPYEALSRIKVISSVSLAET